MPDPSAPLHAPRVEATPPISDAQRRELDAADAREQRFALAPKLAAFNAVGLGLCAVFALLSAVFDVTGLLFAVVLAGLAAAEWHGRKLLLDHRQSGLRWLWTNQLVLIAFVWLYGTSQIHLAWNAQSPVSQVMQEHPELAEALGETDIVESTQELYRYGVAAFYGLVIAVVSIFQGACALYYFTRRKPLEAFVTSTPAWVIEFRRSRR
jgi:hypothetical protein